MASWVRPYAKVAADPEDKDDLENLFVFGYHCKVFRDDEKATYVDQGRHLIPWMGDSSLMIDRYDGRGHLYDLAPFDATNVPRDHFYLTDEEQRLEQLCDEERYLELHVDLAEQAVYEEEEIKRINEACNDNPYAAVGFNYDQPAGGDQQTAGQTAGQTAEQQTQECVAEDEENEEETYEPAPELQVPPGMYVPPTIKFNAIMEKTAKFISEQGQQMEIVIKTKQKNNAQFDFLDFSHYLNPYYRQLVKMIKSGKYKPKLEEKSRKRSYSGEHYLHPSLHQRNEGPIEEDIDSQKFLNSVQSKLPAGQIANTPYAKLLLLAQHTGRNSPDPNTISQGKKPVSAVGSTMHTDFGGYSGSGQYQQSDYDLSHTQLYGVGQEHMYGDQYQGGMPPPPGMEPVTLPGSNQPPPPGTVPPQQTPGGTVPPQQAPPGGTTEQPHTEHQHPQTGPPDPSLPVGMVPPSLELQPIVDKMAAYVAKNGPDFETVVKSKTDERFDFLHSWHILFPYYHYKKQQAEKEIAEEKVKISLTQKIKKPNVDIMVAKRTSHNRLQPKVDKPVSFSIKVKEQGKESGLGSRRTALLYESSDEEGDGGKSQMAIEAETWAEMQAAAPPVVIKEERPEKITVSAEEQERKLAEERLKDKLAVAARDKLAQASKEEQIKAERKRKAAMFISMLKGSGPATAPPPPPGGSTKNEELKDATEVSTPVISVNSPKTSRSSSPTHSLPSKPASISTTPRAMSPVVSRSNRVENRKKSRSRSRSRSRSSSKSKPRYRRRSRSPKKSRSRSPKRRRSRSPKRRKREKTPPSAYSIIRRSRSPPKKPNIHSRSKSPLSKLKKRPKRSKSPSPPKTKRSRSRSKSKSRKRSRSRSKSKLMKKRSRSRSPKTKKRSRSKSPKTKSPKSPSKSKSRGSKVTSSKSRRRSRSKSPPSTKRKSSKTKSPSSKSRRSRSKSPELKKPKSRSPSPTIVEKHTSRSPLIKKREEFPSPPPSTTERKSRSPSPTKSLKTESRASSPSKFVKSESRSSSPAKSTKSESRSLSPAKSTKSESQLSSPVRSIKTESRASSPSKLIHKDFDSDSYQEESGKASIKVEEKNIDKTSLTSKYVSESPEHKEASTKPKSRSRSRSRSISKSKTKITSECPGVRSLSLSSDRISGKPPVKPRNRSRSRSKSKSRKRSRSRSKSKSKLKRRSRSRSISKSSKSKSKSKKRSRSRSNSRSKSSRSRRRSRSRSPGKNKSSKSKRRSRSTSKSRSKKKPRSRSGSRSKKRSRSRSPGKSKSKKRSKRKSRSKSRSPSKSGSKSKSTATSRNADHTIENGSERKELKEEQLKVAGLPPDVTTLAEIKSECSSDGTASPATSVSTDLMSKVRAMLKASRKSEEKDEPEQS